MKFQFKIQSYQTEAVESIVKVFNGQRYQEKLSYIRDIGKTKNTTNELNLSTVDEYGEELDLIDTIGFKNEAISLSDDHLLKNIHELQSKNDIRLCPTLIKDLGCCSLDVDMETGTGKTYVYIKTMFELNKHYGWNKFVVVVPSIAIREGVKKSLEITQEHFMEHYKKKARFFIYNSSNLTPIDNFSSSSGINVMIINVQAFNARGAAARRIYEKLDTFASRRPIDVIKSNRPIVILDEPQKMGGEKTQNALKEFNPLFIINYSATHKKRNNLVYTLDALDAYNKRLVKKIEVKGFEVKNFRGTDQYLYLESIILSSKNPPMARMEFEVLYNNSINRKTFRVGVEDDLYYKSNKMEQYKEGYTISDIDPEKGTVTFTNGVVISKGDLVGDVSEQDMRRIQIRETIISHFEKEETLFNMGIKTLSLFFIDEVAKYRIYNENNEEEIGKYGKIFEEEYNNILKDYVALENTPYQQYLKMISTNETHKGYFSIDKKTGRSIDSIAKDKSEFSDDISAYDLILKNKERLLSFEEPTRFIFSHSALREGWDNPNVFQICTLKHSESAIMKRQEVGRGLRLCVSQSGNRMDAEACGNNIHTINKLTVIASESYKTFVADLQKEIKGELYDRPSKATIEYFEGKTIKIEENQVVIDAKQANAIHRYLIKSNYITNDDKVTDLCRADLANNCFVELPEELKPMEVGIRTLIQGIFDDSVLNSMTDNGNVTKIQDNTLNENFYKKEFQTLWNYINHKYAYTVHFDSKELIEKSIKYVNEKLFVSPLQYTSTIGEQRKDMNEHELARNASFGSEKTSTKILQYVHTSQVKYDLIGKIAEGTTLTRKTVATILKGIDSSKLSAFKNNPEEFISKVIKLIKEQKATMIVEHIAYNQIDGEYDSTIFTAEKHSRSFEKAFKAQKHIQDYVFTDGTAEKSVEQKFTKDLDEAQEVCVYAKLPRGFAIPTPLGNYTPDWAIAFNKDSVKHIYFIAETKGSMDSLNIRPIETAKINCAKSLFNKLSTSKVKYHDVTSYQNLLDRMNSI